MSDELRAAAERAVRECTAMSEAAKAFAPLTAGEGKYSGQVVALGFLAAEWAGRYLAEHPADGWDEDRCFALNAGQHDHSRHPYTCGTDSTDSTHRPLIATRRGWRCADCDYRQDSAHGVPVHPGAT